MLDYKKNIILLLKYYVFKKMAGCKKNTFYKIIIITGCC